MHKSYIIENFSIKYIQDDEEILIGIENYGPQDARFIRLSISYSTDSNPPNPYNSYRIVSFDGKKIGKYPNLRLDNNGITLIMHSNYVLNSRRGEVYTR